ncbi:MAG: App1 family protein [Verrucomicrobiota bacterium]
MEHLPPSIAKRFALFLELIYKFIHRLVARITGHYYRPMTCEVFYAIQRPAGVSVKGRVMRVRKWREPQQDDPAWRNFCQMIKRWLTPERPHSRVSLECDGVETDTLANKEAYFEATIPISADTISPVGAVTFGLPEATESSPTMREVTRSSPEASHIIISDIDDTILVTHAAHTLRMLATTLLGNALTREVFPGVTNLYAALQRGTVSEGSIQNPIHYVTSSPWNLHGLIRLIFQRYHLPDGAWFMTDWGLDESKWFKLGHDTHKLAAIRQSLQWYPDLPAVLIGDTGQHDSEIYAEVVKEFPDRVSHVLLRDVTGPERRKEIEESWEGVGDRETTPMTVFETSEEAARALAAGGVIPAEEARKVGV